MTQPALEAEVFLQWKGTNACFDLNCPCGTQTHFDGDFLYFVECGGCRQAYRMGTNPGATPIEMGSEGDFDIRKSLNFDCDCEDESRCSHFRAPSEWAPVGWPK